MKLTQTKIKLDNNFTSTEFKIDEGIKNYKDINFI